MKYETARKLQKRVAEALNEAMKGEGVYPCPQGCCDALRFDIKNIEYQINTWADENDEEKYIGVLISAEEMIDFSKPYKPRLYPTDAAIARTLKEQAESNGRGLLKGRRSTSSRNGGSSPKKNGRASSASGKPNRRALGSLWQSYVESRGESEQEVQSQASGNGSSRTSKRRSSSKASHLK